jgi:peptidoglycan/LPS O-acetylase OafA/YrhL
MVSASDIYESETGRLGRIHVLRGLAAVLVLVHHLAVWDGNAGAGILPPGPGLGWVGVDLFFVLSGFIITYATRHMVGGRASAIQFLISRAGRVFPVYWAVLAGVIAALVLGRGLIANNGAEHLLLDALLMPGAGPPILGPAWTLVHEVHFYLLFALFLFAPRQSLWAVVSVWGAIIVLGALFHQPDEGGFLRLAFNPLNLMFIWGVLAGLLISVRRTRFAWPALILGGGGLAAGTLVVHVLALESGYAAEWLRAAVCGLPAAMLIYGVAAIDRAYSWRVPKPLEALGDWSYALYLVHLPVIYLVCNLATGGRTIEAYAVEGANPDPLPRAGAFVLAIALSFGLAFVLHRYVERPTLRRARSFSRRLGERLA